MSRRLVSFFNQPPFDLTRKDLGRTGRDWARAALERPGAHRQVLSGRCPPGRPLPPPHPAPRRDLSPIAEGYTNADILVECVTYERPAWSPPASSSRWPPGICCRTSPCGNGSGRRGQTEQLAILNEIIRLEPVVGHLYRRVQQPIEFAESGTTTAAEGDLIDLCIRPTNADPATVGADPLDLCPGRDLPPGVDASVLSFGHGAHRCPGQPLALLESAALLERLLTRDVSIVSEPEITWDRVAGYGLRGFALHLGPAPTTGGE